MILMTVMMIDDYNAQDDDDDDDVDNEDGDIFWQGEPLLVVASPADTIRGMDWADLLCFSQNIHDTLHTCQGFIGLTVN